MRGQLRTDLETRGDDVRLIVFEATPIGEGALSSVYRGTWGTLPVAVKRLIFRADGAYHREAEIHSKLNHENIMKYLGIRSNAVGTYDIVLELANGVTLGKALYRRNLTLEWKRSTIYQLSNGLAYLHGRGILHLDLKPPNILFRDRDLEHLLIADFGMARFASSSRRAGAMKFRAPDFPYTQKSDVYSLASIACCILVGWNPSSPEETKGLIGRLNTDLYPNWRNALNRGVQTEHYKRPSAQEFRDAFALPPYSLEIEPEVYIRNARPTRTTSLCRCLAVVAIAVAVFVILAAVLIWLLYPKEARE